MGSTRRQTGCSELPSCPSCRVALKRALAVEGVGRLSYVDSDGEERVALLVELTDLTLECLSCSAPLPSTGLPGPSGGRFRVVVPEDPPEGVDMFDSREHMSAFLAERCEDEVDLDYELAILDASLAVVANDGWLDLSGDVITVEETEQAV